MTPAGPRLRVSVVGTAGSGKSTSATLIEEFARHKGLGVARVKLAKPLYDLQEQVYRAAGVKPAEGAQDQVLMEALADALRRIRPRSLVDDFSARLVRAEAGADLVLTDDLRDPYVDAPELRRLGFRVLRVTCAEEVRLSRLAGRGDLSRSDASTRSIGLIEPDAVVDNSADRGTLRELVHAVMRSWL
jgi:dephospho-CoA kinase